MRATTSDVPPAAGERLSFREFVQGEDGLTQEQKDLLVSIYASWGLEPSRRDADT